MAFPAGLKVFIEFGTLYSNVWTDVTADVDASVQGRMHFGRTKPGDAASAATLNIRLENNLGSYTPQRQVLADGVTAHPYYPNVLPDKRIKVSWTISAVEYPRFIGFIDSWTPGLENGVRPYVDIAASDVLNRLSRVTLQATMMQELLADDPDRLWTLSEPAGATLAADYSGNNGLPLASAGALPTFGAPGPGAGDGTSATFTTGQWLETFYGPPAGAWTWEVWINLTSNPSSGCNIITNILAISSAGNIFLPSGPLGPVLPLATWHHVAITVAAGGAYIYYLDGTVIDSGTGFPVPPAAIYLGDPGSVSFSGLSVNLGYFGAYPSQLSAGRIGAHYAAGTGYYGDTTGARVARVLTLAGLTSSQWNLDTGQALVGTYPQAGKTVLQYCQDMAVTEGGGAVFYVTPDGKARFADRNFRNPGSPQVTIDATKDLSGSSYLPSFDKTTMQNQAIISRSAESGVLSTQTYTLSTQYQLVSQGLTTYATTDADALANGQYEVASNAYPGFRFPQVGVSLLTAVNNLYVAVAGVQIGSRLRLSAIPAGKAPATQVDVLVEGWTETFSFNTYDWVADTSPSDNPPIGLYDDSTYGRYSGGFSTLTSTITAAATSLSITTSSGPTWSTTSGDYPMKIQIGQEVIQLNSVPGGSTSPQAFTGVTRGVNGTPAAAQSSGTSVDVFFAATYAL